MLFDTHAHLNFKDYDKDREKLIKNSLKEGVFMINIGTDIKESRRVVKISEDYREGVYACVGLHPLHTKEEDFNKTLPEYEKLAENLKVVAIGETGLDKHGENFEKQKDVFLKHIELAKKASLPLVLHCRKAHQELLQTLNSFRGSTSENGKNLFQGVVHCFTGGKKELKQYLDMGFHIGLNGIIFKINLEEVIKEVPMERILLETDCPFLTPPPEKGRNEPLFIKHIAKEVARIKKKSVEEVEKKTTQNARELFNV